MKKIGILGGGQLGMLLAQSIVRLGADAWVYDPDPQAPACRAVKHSVNASWHDKRALSDFIASCDRVTYEFENVPYDCLADLEQPIPVFPSLEVLKITQNRIHEKEFLRKNGLPHVPYVIANNLDELQASIYNLEFPVIIKSATGGYDGKGQIYLQCKEDLEKQFVNTTNSLSLPFPVIAEQAIDLHMEVSSIVGFNGGGKKVAFPIFENIHRSHILDTTLMPARLSEDMASAVKQFASQAASKLNLSGLLCTEFFIGRKKTSIKTGFSVGEFDLFINEMAPRPHNSGHVTISGCTFSQFDVLARVLLDLPLPSVELIGPGYFCMANLLGDIWIDQGAEETDKLNFEDLSEHKELIGLIVYGKNEARPGRKMGHLVTWSTQAEKAIDAAKSVREELRKLKATE
jgi:5-(carboxyamino)imidazole ribonucleotide synthase